MYFWLCLILVLLWQLSSYDAAIPSQKPPLPTSNVGISTKPCKCVFKYQCNAKDVVEEDLFMDALTLNRSISKCSGFKICCIAPVPFAEEMPKHDPNQLYKSYLQSPNKHLPYNTAQMVAMAQLFSSGQDSHRSDSQSHQSYRQKFSSASSYKRWSAFTQGRTAWRGHRPSRFSSHRSSRLHRMNYFRGGAGSSRYPNSRIVSSPKISPMGSPTHKG